MQIGLAHSRTLATSVSQWTLVRPWTNWYTCRANLQPRIPAEPDCQDSDAGAQRVYAPRWSLHGASDQISGPRSSRSNNRLHFLVWVQPFCSAFLPYSLWASIYDSFLLASCGLIHEACISDGRFAAPGTAGPRNAGSAA